MKKSWKEARENAEKNKRIEICVSEEELAVIKSKAKKLHLKTAPYIRRMATVGEIIIFNTKELSDLNEEINRIGNNINQIAHTANSTHNISRDEIDTVLSEQQKIKDNLSDYFEILKPKVVRKCRSLNT